MKNKKLVVTLKPLPNRGSASDDMETVKKLIHQMDFNLLKAQKKVLCNLQAKKTVTKSEFDALEGIINFIDSIQDIAVDVYGYSTDMVFNHEGKMTLAQAREIVKG
jgi:hypothetical protein